MSARIYARIERRETHSPRSAAAIVVASALVLALAYLVAEIVLAALGDVALLVSPARMVQDTLSLPSVATWLLILSGAVLLLLGAVLLRLAIAPGRRARHVQRSDRAAIVIDDEVIASALVRAAAGHDGVSPDRAVGSVSRRRATVRITPSSGLPVDTDAVGAAVRDRLDAWGLEPALQGRVVLERTGEVGA